MSHIIHISPERENELNRDYISIVSILRSVAYSKSDSCTSSTCTLADAVNLLFDGIPYVVTLDDRCNQRLKNAFVAVFEISILSIEPCESNGSQQYKVHRCLTDLFAKVVDSGHVHSVVGKCKSYNANTNTCNYLHELVDADGSKSDTASGIMPQFHRFVCDYHSESVISHLFRAAIHSGAYAILNGWSDEHVIMAVLLGLYHDVGKPQTAVTYEFKNGIFTGFPAHAEFGAALFGVYWTPEMAKYITFENFELVTNAIRRHMCGYHGSHTSDNMFKRELLRGIETKQLIDLLCSLRMGDHFGKSDMTPESNTDESNASFLDEQTKFENYMSQKPDKFDFHDFLKGHKYQEKVVVLLNGTSGVGKSWFATNLKNRYPGKVVVCSRDMYIAFATVGILARLEGLAYVLSHRIYKAENPRDIQAAQNAWNEFVAKEMITNPSTLLRPVVVYEPSIQSNHMQGGKGKGKKNQTDPNLPKFSKQVCDSFHMAVSDALASGAKMVVIDTLMNLFANALKWGIPSLSSYFCIDVHIHSFVERTETTVAVSIEKQLEISGAYSTLAPFHPSAMSQSNPASLKRFASRSSDSNFDGTPTHGEYRPNLVLGYTRTPFGDIGINTVFNTLDTVVDGLGEEVNHGSESKNANDTNRVELRPDTSHPSEQQPSSNSCNDSMNRANPEGDEKIEDESIPGVDPATKGMNLCQFHDHLLTTYRGDISKVREFFRTHGFHYNRPLWRNLANLGEDERRSQCTTLVNILKSWADDEIVSREYSVDELMANNNELYENLSSSIVLLKYIDGFQGPAMWHNRWARQARGATLFIPQPDMRLPTEYRNGSPANKYRARMHAGSRYRKGMSTKFIRYMMERGGESLTHMTQTKGIATQDVPESSNPKAPKLSKIKVFDPEQQDTCRSLCEGTEINTCLSSKADGSLFVVTVYRGESMKIMLPVLKELGNDFIKSWVRMSLELTNGEAIVVPSTQGTLFEGGFMASYLTTSILAGSGIASRRELEKFNTYEDAWNAHGSTWLRRFLKMRRFDEMTEVSCFLFEAVCRHRRGLWEGITHMELAISYEEDRIVFLGYTAVDYAHYMPHMLYSEYCRNILGIAEPVPFEEPLWWRITHASQVDKMMECLYDVLRRKITKQQFLLMFPPTNVGFDPNNIEMVNRAIIDFEGWVSSKFCKYSISDPLYTSAQSRSTELYGSPFPSTSYSKIKTEAYYISHKPKTKNMAELIELADVASDIFPITGRIKDLLSPDAIAFALEGIGRDIMTVLDFSENSNLMMQLKDVSEKARDADSTGTKSRRNPFANFDKRSLDVKCKIALNFEGFDAATLLLLPIYKHHIPSLDLGASDVAAIVRSLTVTLKPWEPTYSDNIKKLSVSSPVMQNLIVACLGIALD